MQSCSVAETEVYASRGCERLFILFASVNKALLDQTIKLDVKTKKRKKKVEDREVWNSEKKKESAVFSRHKYRPSDPRPRQLIG